MNAYGQDMRGTPNILLDDGHLPHILGALITAGLVQVEKLADGDAEGFGGEAELASPRRHRPWPSRSPGQEGWRPGCGGVPWRPPRLGSDPVCAVENA